VIFDVEGKNVTYKTAGNLAIYAENSQEDVEKFASLLNLDLNSTIKLVLNDQYTGRKS
jgi:sulfite reductase alpha subunit-like flavoprotein